MKKTTLLIILFLVASLCKAQMVNTWPIGEDSSISQMKGVLGIDDGLVFTRNFADTTAANAFIGGRLKGIALLYVTCGNKVYLRSLDKTHWVEQIGLESALPISSLSDAIKDNVIDNLNYEQSWNWNTINGQSGLHLKSNSTTSTGSGNALLNIELIGTSLSSNEDNCGIIVNNTHSSADGQNYGAIINATNDVALNNYGIVVSASGSGATTANMGLKVTASGGVTNNAVQLVDGTQGTGKVLTSDAAGVASWQTSAGSGTVNTGTANRLAYYPTSTAAVSALSAITANRALISDGSGLPTHSATTATELSYVSGVTSSIQTQLNAKGIGTIGGSIAATYLGVGTGTNTLGGSNELAYSSGNLNVGNSTTGNSISVNSAWPGNSYLRLYHTNVATSDWVLYNQIDGSGFAIKSNDYNIYPFEISADGSWYLGGQAYAGIGDYIRGNTSGNIAIRQKLSIGTTANPTEALDVTGNTKVSGTGFYGSDFQVNGVTALQSDATVGGQLSITGNTNLSSALVVNSSTGSANQKLTSRGAGLSPVWKDTVVTTSGTYTPTLSNTTNVTSSTPIVCHYARVGNQVTVTGSAGIVTTLAVSTVLSISLPVASNLSATTDAAGIGQATSAVATNAYVQGNATSDLAELTFIGLSVGGSGTIYFTFTYTVI